MVTPRSHVNNEQHNCSLRLPLKDHSLYYMEHCMAINFGLSFQDSSKFTVGSRPKTLLTLNLHISPTNLPICHIYQNFMIHEDQAVHCAPSYEVQIDQRVDLKLNRNFKDCK